MPIVNQTAPIRELRMELFHVTYPGDPLPQLSEPHVFVTVRRGEDDATSVKFAVVHAIRSGELRMAPAGEQNFETAVIKAAYAHRGSYKGTRSLLRGCISHVPLIACYVFREPKDAPTAFSVRGRAGP